MRTEKTKFSSQAAPEVLAALKAIAEQEGRQFQAVLDEAMQEYIERKKNGVLRRKVTDAFEASLNEFDGLYRKLAE